MSLNKDQSIVSEIKNKTTSGQRKKIREIIDPKKLLFFWFARWFRALFAGSSLSYRVLRRGVIGSIIIILIISFGLFFIEKINEKRLMAEKSATVKLRVSSVFALPFWNLDMTMIDSLVDIEMMDEDIMGFAMHDKTGSFFKGFYKNRNSKKIQAFEVESYKKTVFQGSTMSVRAPFMLDGQFIGYADIYFTNESILQHTWQRILEMFVMLAFVGCAIFIFLHGSIQRKVIGPVEELSVVVNEFSKRNFSIRSPIYYDDQMGSLALHFNEMANTIEQYSLSMQKMVDERTQQLINAEKMASLGELVAGVSHEINTPVGIAITAASFLECSVSQAAERLRKNEMTRSELFSFLEQTEQAMTLTLSNLNRASDLIQSFKKIAVDRSTDDRRKFNFKRYLHDISMSLQPRLKRTTHVIDVRCDDTLEVDSYPGDIWQVLTNFIMNSLVHAFPSDDSCGVIIIEAHRESDMVVIRYHDDGCGIHPDHLPKIFMPFFTTKRGYGGSGLGLNVVYNTVTQKLGGTIECRSEPGSGTEFIIRFPG